MSKTPGRADRRPQSLCIRVTPLPLPELPQENTAGGPTRGDGNVQSLSSEAHRVLHGPPPAAPGKSRVGHVRLNSCASERQARSQTRGFPKRLPRGPSLTSTLVYTGCRVALRLTAGWGARPPGATAPGALPDLSAPRPPPPGQTLPSLENDCEGETWVHDRASPETRTRGAALPSGRSTVLRPATRPRGFGGADALPPGEGRAPAARSSDVAESSPGGSVSDSGNRHGL